MADKTYDDRRRREVSEPSEDREISSSEPGRTGGVLRTELRNIDCWIFDLDGTLTVAVHDFDAIRSELDVPTGKPILEFLAGIPEAEARKIRAQLDVIEKRLARRAQPSPGASELLEALAARGAEVGILTRNSHENAALTLRECGLSGYFRDASILGREQASPKPDPDGIQVHLRRWNADPARAVMVGDYLFDLQAGRAARTTTVFYDAEGTGRWSDHADRTVRHLAELI